MERVTSNARNRPLVAPRLAECRRTRETNRSAHESNPSPFLSVAFQRVAARGRPGQAFSSAVSTAIHPPFLRLMVAVAVARRIVAGVGVRDCGRPPIRPT